jgi:hypothetical protein
VKQLQRADKLSRIQPFYAALGIPMVLDAPVGRHEVHNRDWCMAAGAGRPCEELDPLPETLLEALEDGSLAAQAWKGHQNLTSDGTRRVVELLRTVAQAPP